MISSLPVGTVCPFAGQIDPRGTTSTPNSTWAGSACPAGRPVSPQPAPDAPANNLEAQGWMLCDGRWLACDAFAELYAALGDLYGSKSDGGTARFRIPDYRGLFLRGFDAGSGMDPDAAQRLAANGSSTANQVGSFQCDALQDHTHNYDVTNASAVSQSGQAAGVTITSKPTTSPNTPAARVSSGETRPRNIAVNYIIKFR
ncbi:tail fiber protein [Imhoffiella purpurea]|uniref:tail fiber protein n=1 Tax=Imhoffiella purpurea TaxID=1249627 RepID=UPI0009DD0501|nr:tail fiber protein [Imhoffiella purpurea]